MADRKPSLAVGFQIEYEVKPSNICPDIGMGIFARNFIPCGSLIWKYCRDANVLSYSNKDDVKCKLDKLEQKDREFFMSHVYLFDGVMNEILDDGKYWNHVSKFLLTLRESREQITEFTSTAANYCHQMFPRKSCD